MGRGRDLYLIHGHIGDIPGIRVFRPGFGEAHITLVVVQIAFERSEQPDRRTNAELGSECLGEIPGRGVELDARLHQPSLRSWWGS